MWWSIASSLPSPIIARMCHTNPGFASIGVSSARPPFLKRAPACSVASFTAELGAANTALHHSWQNVWMDVCCSRLVLVVDVIQASPEYGASKTENTLNFAQSLRKIATAQQQQCCQPSGKAATTKNRKRTRACWLISLSFNKMLVVPMIANLNLNAAREVANLTTNVVGGGEDVTEWESG